MGQGAYRGALFPTRRTGKEWPHLFSSHLSTIVTESSRLPDISAAGQTARGPTAEPRASTLGTESKLSGAAADLNMPLLHVYKALLIPYLREGLGFLSQRESALEPRLRFYQMNPEQMKCTFGSLMNSWNFSPEAR